MTSRRHFSFRLSWSLALAVAAMICSAAIAFAYPPPAASGSLKAGCTTANPGANCLLTFHFVDGSNNPITGAPVVFGDSGVAGSYVTPTSGTTDPGDVQTTFFAGSTACGTATVTATSGSAVASTSISVPCTGGGTLPNTGTALPGPSQWIYLLIAAAVLGVLGGAISLRRTRATA